MARTSTSARPYAARVASPRRRGAGSTLLGIFIGLVAGLALAAGVAYWLMKNNPALPIPSVAKEGREAVRDAARGKAEADKPRFDFYKILPGVEEPKVQVERKAVTAPDRSVAEQARDKAAEKSTDKATGGDGKAATAGEKVAAAEPGAKGTKAADRFWLQAGSFGAAGDAENLKARLALDGWEAQVQEGNVPDKGMRYRVRLGPYDSADELNRMKKELARRGFDVAVIKY